MYEHEISVDYLRYTMSTKSATYEYKQSGLVNEASTMNGGVTCWLPALVGELSLYLSMGMKREFLGIDA